MNLTDFYSYRLIGKLTTFLHFQEFSLSNPPVDYSISSSRLTQQFKNRVGLTLVKEVSLRITFNLDGTPITSKSHTHPSHLQTSRLLTSIFRCSSSPSNPVYPRHVDSSPLGLSLSSHRHIYRFCL